MSFDWVWAGHHAQRMYTGASSRVGGRHIALPVMVWVWACIVAPVLCAAASPEYEQAQRGATTPSPQEVASANAKSAIVTAITSDIILDGSLDELAWQTAPKIGDLTQREPLTGDKPSERTEVTLLHDANYLYIGVICYDSEPDRIIGTQMARDSKLDRTDDRIEILLDTYRDRRNAFYFSTNPVGALVDGLVYANGQSDMNWDGIWNVRTRLTQQGWTAEFAIPFKSLSFPSGRTTWGFNFGRYIQRKLEDDRWSGARIQTLFFQVSEAGEITELRGITQGRGLQIRPFASSRWFHSGSMGRNTINGKPGLDMFYNLTPSLKLTATANTDFGETEVDARQINLSRSSVFFPEKRSFFLEDTGVFSFSNTSILNYAGLPSTGAEVIPFFSRKVGLLSGEEVPIDVGLKLTGKVGRTDLGVLDLRTRDVSIVSAKNLFVGRVKQNFLQQSYVGAIVTQGNPALPITSSTLGVDVRVATSSFLGNKNLVFNGYGLKSANEGSPGRDASYGISLEYPNDVLHLEFISREIQENFRPALGFVSRRNVRLLKIQGRYAPRPRNFLNLQQWWNDVTYTRFTRLDNGQTESWKLDLMAVSDVHFKTGDGVHGVFWPSITFERLFAPFQIFPGIFLPPDEYRFVRWKTHLTTAAKRRLEGTVQWVQGTYWSGHAQELNTTLIYKFPPHFRLGFNTNQTFAKLPQGDFVARILSGQVDYAASPFLTFSNLIQYDNVSRNLGWQGRLRWIMQPGNDLFFVFNQGWIQDARGGFQFDAADRGISTKIQYSFRF